MVQPLAPVSFQVFQQHMVDSPVLMYHSDLREHEQLCAVKAVPIDTKKFLCHHQQAYSFLLGSNTSFCHIIFITFYI